MHGRIRVLREDKGLSRAVFDKKLEVSGDVINNPERGRVETKDHIVKLICVEYSINEIWLRTGNGSMYIEPDTREMLVDRFRKGLAAPAPATVEKEKTVEELDEYCAYARYDSRFHFDGAHYT